MTSLEVDTAAELNRALWNGVVAKGETGDVSKCSATHGYVGVANEFCVVGHIECLGAKLELAFMVDLEAARETCVHVGNPRSTKLVAAGIAKVR